ncbi:uncharacterized protein [Rutidosis leptorrhynchoides]|uniref:uncharacterized protein n=1 Tax=Rutidosis leptorrhynchoides TaxID=125765 RepID=UPI003A995117
MAEELYVEEYLRKSTCSDIAHLYSVHEEMHGFKGMLRSINCMHWNKNGTGPLAPSTVNGNNYTNGYYLADGIYPYWATLIRPYSTPTYEQHAKFKRFQESARKDVKRTFGVLQGKFHILQMTGRSHSVNKMRRILYCCVLLHNMIVEDNGHTITWLEEELLKTDEANSNFVKKRSTTHETREKEIRDRDIHNQLRHVNLSVSLKL